MRNGTTTLLGLEGYRIGETRQNDKGIMVEVMGRRCGLGQCPWCGSARLYRHGFCKPRRLLHGWLHGKKVYLELHRQRFRCRDCGKSFTGEDRLARRYSRLTRKGEGEALWQLRAQSFAQVGRELGVGYGTLRRLLEREIDEETLGYIGEEGAIYLGIDEHSFRHQEMVYTVTEVKKRRVLAILRDDRIATLKQFLVRIPKDRVKEACIDMKESLRKAVEEVLPQAKVVADPFHVVADANKRVDEARRIEQDVQWKRKVKIPRMILLIGGDKLGQTQRERVAHLQGKYPGLQGFYWAKEKVRELYQQTSREAARKLLENIIFNLKSSDDGEMIRWGNTLKRWSEPILNHFENGTTNAYTEGCHTKIKMLKRLSYGLKNAQVYWRKMLLGFVPSRSCFHTI